MGRELRRVPLDFDWPIDEIWSGYLRPEELNFPTCLDCDGSGYSPAARAIANTFYPHQIGGRDAAALAWHDKIGQAEVDNLVERGRLRVWRDGKWVTEPRTAEEINTLNHRPGLDGHDGINRYILISFRCKLLGIIEQGPTCSGHGDIATTEEREASENWEGTDPPEGDGYQLWNTTTEGQPMTPVFATLDELCDHAAQHCTVFASDRASAEGWKHMLTDGLVASVAVAADGTKHLFI